MERDSIGLGQEMERVIPQMNPGQTLLAYYALSDGFLMGEFGTNSGRYIYDRLLKNNFNEPVLDGKYREFYDLATRLGDRAGQEEANNSPQGIRVYERIMRKLKEHLSPNFLTKYDRDVIPINQVRVLARGPNGDGQGAILFKDEIKWLEKAGLI